MTFAPDFSLSMPITHQTKAFAQRCVQSLPPGNLAQRVWEHGIAVGVVGQYLDLLGIPFRLEHSDLTNPVIQLTAAIANLEVLGIGWLECCVVQADASDGQVSPEVWSDRIGYVFVRMNPDQRSADILGFTPQISEERIALSRLSAIAELGIHLHQVQTQLLRVDAPSPLVKLGDWIHGIISDGWQMLEASTLFSQTLSGYGFRWSGASETSEQESRSQTPEILENQAPEPIRCAKILQNWLPINGQEGTVLPEPVVLVVEVSPNERHTTRLSLQVHPTSERRYLPPEIELIVLDQAGDSFLSAKSRQQDDYIQLQFNGVAGESFGVRVIAHSNWVQEFFQI